LKKNIKVDKDRIVSLNGNLDGVSMSWHLAFRSKDDDVKIQAGKFLREVYMMLWKDCKSELPTVLRSYVTFGIKEVQPAGGEAFDKAKTEVFLQTVLGFVQS
jgi:hypothetical protein